MSNINQDYIVEYIRSVIRKNGDLLQTLEAYAKDNHVPIIQPEVGELLKVLLLTHKPKKILEVGTAIGYSAIMMAQATSEDTTIYTIERYEKMQILAKENIEQANLAHRIHMIEGDAEEVLPQFQEKVDLIFMDAAKGQYPIFFPECMRLLNPGGLLISDNILYQGMVATNDLVIRRKKTIVKRLRDYLKVLCEHPSLQTSILPIGDGVAISYRID